MSDVPVLKMSNGLTIPQLALGLWLNKDAQSCLDSVKWALDAGYRHFDSAQAYHNEQYLGRAVKDSGIDRGELFITTKIQSNQSDNNQTESKLLPSFEESLKKLQMDYVDLLLLHFPRPETRRQAWPVMEKINKSGKAKSIGVSNYTVRHLEELLDECDIKPAVNQVELHVFLQQPELVKFCQDNDIVIEAYSPLAHGQRMDDSVLQSIAKKHGKTVAQIEIRWCLEIGAVPLPKSANQERLKQNLDVFDFKLDSDDMAGIAKLDDDYRTCWDPSDVE